MQSYASRFAYVRILDEHGNHTGKIGQVFGRLVDDQDQYTGKLAVMLTTGGQGLEYVPDNCCEVINGA